MFATETANATPQNTCIQRTESASGRRLRTPANEVRRITASGTIRM